MKFVTFRLEFSPGTELPQKILVAKWGANKSVNGDYIVNETTARQLPLNLKSVNFDTVDLDFNHNRVPGSPAYKAEKEPRNRAAYGPLELVAGEGVYLHTAPDRWTPEGKAAVTGKHFQDISPAILVNKKNEVVFIHSVALTEHGATSDLELQLNSASPLLALFTDETTPAMLDYKKLLLSVLDLPDTASDTQITDGIKKECGEPDASAAGALKTMSAKIDDLSTKLVTIEKAGAQAERESLITRAIAAGKIVGQSAHEMPIDLLKKHLAELPPDQVPLERRTPEGIKTHASGILTSGNAAVEEEVRQKMGITKEAWDKANKS